MNRMLPLIFLLALSAILAWGMYSKHTRQNIPLATTVKQAAPLQVQPLLGGETPSIEQLRGQKILVNFFASWCVPCLMEHQLFTQLKGKIFLYGIAWKNKPEDVTPWLQKNGNPYDAVALDASSSTAISYGVTGVPESFLIDEEGNIIYHHTGPLSQEIIEGNILPLLAKKEGE